VYRVSVAKPRYGPAAFDRRLHREPPCDRLIGDRLEQSCPNSIQEAVGYGVSGEFYGTNRENQGTTLSNFAANIR
jgi:hypothetical protein